MSAGVPQPTPADGPKEKRAAAAQELFRRHDGMTWQPYREPLSTTLVRTGTIALVAGAALAGYRGGLARWPMGTLLALWPALGGHFVELCFLNCIRPRLPDAPAVQAGVRVGVWFVAGAGLALGIVLTARALGELRPGQWSVWRVCGLGGLAFIGIEGVAHLLLQLGGKPSFFNGRG